MPVRKDRFKSFKLLQNFFQLFTIIKFNERTILSLYLLCLYITNLKTKTREFGFYGIQYIDLPFVNTSADIVEGIVRDQCTSETNLVIRYKSVPSFLTANSPLKKIEDVAVIWLQLSADVN